MAPLLRPVATNAPRSAIAARVDPELDVTMRVGMPGRPEVPLLECLELRRRSRLAAAPRWLVLRGELCGYSTPFLRDHLERHAGAESVVLDIAGIRLIDSSALDLCDAIDRRCASRGSTLRLTGVAGLARVVVDLLELGHLVLEVGTSAEDPVPSPQPVELSIRNLEGDRVIEVMAHGAVEADGVGDVRALVTRLIRAREPGELRIDLEDTTGDVGLAGPLVEASEALWSIGARLVVRHPSEELRDLLPAHDDRIVVEAVLA